MNDAVQKEFNSLMSLAEFSSGRFDQRRNHSWKIALAFWGSIIGSTAVIISDFDHPVSLNYLIIGGAITFILHSFWLKRVFSADKQDKIIAFQARDKAMKLLSLDPPELEIGERGWLGDWSVQFQMATTFLLVVMVILYMNSLIP